MEQTRDLGDTGAVGGGTKNLGLAVGEGTFPTDHGGGGKIGVDVATALVDAADRAGELLHRGVLGEEPTSTGGQGTTQIPGTTETGEDDHTTIGCAAPEFGCDLETGGAGHLDVEDGHCRAVLENGVDDLVTAADLGDDLQVLLQTEQRGYGSTNKVFVIGEHDVDQDLPFRRVADGATRYRSGHHDVSIRGTRGALSTRGENGLETRPYRFLTLF